MMVLLTRWQRRLRRRTLARIVVPSPQQTDLVTLIVIIIGWGALAPTALQANPWLISTNQTETEIVPLQRFWQGEIDLLGFRLTTAQVAPGGTIPVTLYWQASRPVLATYQSEVFLSNSTGEP